MANVLSTDRQLVLLRLLVEGTSLRSITRITGIHRTAVQRWLVIYGNRARSFLDKRLRGLTLSHLELDEIWTYCYCKQGRIPVDQYRARPTIGDQYLFVALDKDTKLVASYALGKRTADLTRRFLVDLSSRLAIPKPLGWKPVTQISTDGWGAYPEAVDLAFGANVQYGQLIKDYRNAEQPGRYAAPEMVAAQRKAIYGDIDPYSICTSHVERNNLTIRHFIKRFARLSLAFSKKFENLAAAVALHVAYFDFVWQPRTTKKSPALAAGIADRAWSLGDLYETLKCEI